MNMRQSLEEEASDSHARPVALRDEAERIPRTWKALLFRRRCEWRNALLQFRVQSWLKHGVIFAFVTAFELGLFAMFYGGFRFIDTLGGAGVMLLGRLFSLYFLSMAIMMTLSSIIAAYSSLFRGGDVAFLLTSPIDLSSLMLHKWLETARISTWSYVFIVGPFVAAYAAFERISPMFVVWTFLFSVPLLLLCAALGALIVLLFARIYPPPGHRRLLHLALGAVALAVLAIIVSQVRSATPREALSWNQIVPGLRIGTHPLQPGYWVSEGIFALREGRWMRGAMFWLTLTTSAGACGVLLEWLGTRVFFDAWTRTRTAAAVGGSARAFAGLNRLLRVLPHDARALIVKDVRTFVRDPLQWSQSLIFFGLLAAYFANLRTVYSYTLAPEWRNLVAFLNAFSVSAVLCSLTSRFVYPQLSLEGQGFWLIGLSPTSPTRILLTKFFAALAALLAITVPLMWLSTRMLRTPPESRWVIMLAIGCVTLAVTGLATGLGAIYLDLEHRNPAAVVSGFGGTLNLVLNLIVTILALLPIGYLFNLEATGSLSMTRLREILRIGLPLLIGISVLAAGIPLALGSRSLSRRDF